MFVPRTGLEPARLAAHAPETCASTNSATWANCVVASKEHVLSNQRVTSCCYNVLRAENGTRTRDPNLGKVVLYQLSYFRVISPNASAKVLLLIKN